MFEIVLIFVGLGGVQVIVGLQTPLHLNPKPLNPKPQQVMEVLEGPQTDPKLGLRADIGVSLNLGVSFWGCLRIIVFWGSILGYPYFVKLPCVNFPKGSELRVGFSGVGV